MHASFLSKNTLYILLWDLSRPQPGEDAAAVTVEMVRKQCEWATLIQTCAPGSTVLLVGSHADEVANPAEIPRRLKHMRQSVHDQLEIHRAAQHAELASVSADSPRGVHLTTVLGSPLRLAAEAIAVSAKTLDGVDVLRERMVEAAFDKAAFPTFVSTQAIYRLLVVSRSSPLTDCL